MYEVSHSSKWEKLDNDSCKLSSLESLGDNDFRNKLRQCVVTLWSWEECQEKSLHRMERKISVMTSCHNRFSKAAQWTESNITKTKMDSKMLFTSYSRTLGRYRSRSKSNGIFFLFLSTGRSTCIEEDFLGLINLHRNMDGFWEERRQDKARQAVFLTLTNPFWKRPRGGKSSWWSHSSTERSFYNILEINSNCSILGSTDRSGGSWIGILADEVVCTYDLRNNTWRLHWSCDIRWWRWSTFRTTWNSKATAQG